ncbi:MAG: hypothetical protein KUG77_27825 [Nannocystaceae bacterium]|nr:hypothetical protein [Nannocystaceae bacterium]
MTPGDDDLEVGIGAIERNAPAGAADATEGLEEIAAVGTADEIAAAAAVDAPGSPLGVDEISAGLAAGSLSPAEAQSMLIDRVVAAQLPEGAAPALVASVQSEVAEALANDPLLAALLDPRR